MSRSLAAAPVRRGAATPASRRSARKPATPAFGLPRPLSAVASPLRGVGALAWRRARLRVALLALALVLPLAAGGWLWFRQSPFVSIQRVQIGGVHGPDAPAVEAALTQAARGMSTLDVSDNALRAAVAPLRVVREVRAIPRFPHALRIEVVEQLPVASLTVGGVRTAVAADGTALGPALLSSSLPSVSGSVMPAAGQRVSGAGLLEELTVLGAAPTPLARHVERVFTGAKGLTVAMRNGLLVYFGDDARPHAKWMSLARVLVDPSSAGASYIDVRLPAHPAAGFPAGVSPPGASTPAAGTTGAGASSGEQPGGSSESTVASLAAALPGGSGNSSTTAAEPSASSGASAPASPSESTSGSPAPPAGTEASPSAQREAPASTSAPIGG